MLKKQLLPLLLTGVIFLALCVIYYGEILLLNTISKQHIVTHIRLQDILIGVTIYLKTSIDFAIFIGNLMKTHSTWQGRIAIETGTAVGNALGTMVVLFIWNFFKEIPLLLFIMIVLASLVLFRLAKDGIEHAQDGIKTMPAWFKSVVDKTGVIIERINVIISPILDKIVPHASMNFKKSLPWRELLIFSFTIPFILGLDDFAGYVPLFNIVNVFGFGIGVMLGHMILNLLLFISPSKTITTVKNPVISYFGSLAFVGIALWGLWEAFHVLAAGYLH